MKATSFLFAISLLLLGSCSEDPELALLREMNTRDKVAQLLVAHHYNPDIDSLVCRDHIGGVIVMASSLSEVNELLPRLKAEATVPLLTCIDAEWGAQMRLREDFPRQLYACEIRSAEQAREVGRKIGMELDSLGIAVNLAPVADVNTNPKSPVIGYRSFSSDVETVCEYASAYAQGLHDVGIGACAKHFPGHGDTAVDSHKALPVLPHDMERLDSVELAPFRRLIAEDVELLMVGHLSVPAFDPSGKPASISKPVYDYIRDSLRFESCIVTDGLMMKGLLNMFEGDDVAASVAAYGAGADLLLGAVDVKEIIDAITEKVESGEFSEEDLDAKVYRVLKLKKKLQILQ
ncbi:MAG: glycoside hydrolase family 3 protein [Candidatus Cryptobacteroides sp.]